MPWLLEKTIFYWRGLFYFEGEGEGEGFILYFSNTNQSHMLQKEAQQKRKHGENVLSQDCDNNDSVNYTTYTHFSKLW